jgi:hypothetical protein
MLNECTTLANSCTPQQNHDGEEHKHQWGGKPRRPHLQVLAQIDVNRGFGALANACNTTAQRHVNGA